VSICERRVEVGVSMMRPGVEAPAQQKSMSGGDERFHSIAAEMIEGPESGSVRS